MPHLWISAGHSGPGESGTQSKDGINERNVTMQILKQCTEIGMKTVPFVNLEKRTQFANNNIPEGDYLIELHCDAADSEQGTDCGVYYFDGNDWSKEHGNQIAQYWRDTFGHSAFWNRPDTAARQGRLGIVRDTKAPAWLIEMVDIDDVAKRDLIIKEGASALKNLEAIMFKQQGPSEWAAGAWEKAQKKGIFNGQDPQGIVTNEMLEIVLHRLGALQKLENILSRERFAVALDRLKLLD